MTAAFAAAETDCVAAIPDRLAALCARLLPVKQVAAAFTLPRLTTVMIWHERTEADPGARIFRELVAKAVAH
jgi:DNA-binding transcriptional LysR family regulator